MREELERQLINIILPYRELVPMEDIKAQITIALSNYEISGRETAIAIRDEDKNREYLARFLATKAARGLSGNVRFPKGRDEQESEKIRKGAEKFLLLNLYQTAEREGLL